MEAKQTPIKAANKLNKIIETFHLAHGGNRFPINVDALAIDASRIFNWDDPITKILSVDIPGFEGMLSPNSSRSKWMIAVNENIHSEGRVRFTKAHELGHYILHRLKHENVQFQCTKEDMLDWSLQSIESEADQFASYLLMPLNDFREIIPDDVNLQVLSDCAVRYGVSLTAAALQWLNHTELNAILLLSRDGFIVWACSSKSALKAGGFFKTRSQTIPVPSKSLINNPRIASDKLGQKIVAREWFPYADSDDEITEMKIFSEHYDSTLTLLLLPQHTSFWPTNNE